MTQSTMQTHQSRRALREDGPRRRGRRIARCAYNHLGFAGLESSLAPDDAAHSRVLDLRVPSSGPRGSLLTLGRVYTWFTLSQRRILGGILQHFACQGCQNRSAPPRHGDRYWLEILKTQRSCYATWTR